MLGKKLVKAAAGNAGAESDPDFANTVLLLHGDGNQGATNFSNTGPTKYLAFSDNSDNNFPITVNGDAYGDNFGPYALDDGYWGNYFDGSANGFVRFTDAGSVLDLSGDFTLEFFAYQNALATLNGTLNMFFSLDTLNRFQCYQDTNSVDVFIDGSLIISYTGTQPAFNTWNHFAITRSGSTVTLYINGTSAATGTSSYSIACSTLMIGGQDRGTSNHGCNAYISNFRVVNGSAIAPPSGGPTSPLTAVSGTSLLTCQSNRFLDNSGNSLSATTVGSTAKVTVFNPFDELPDGVNGSGFFDGTGDYLSTSGTALQLTNNADDFTIECNVYNLGKTGSQYGMGLVTWYVSTGYGSSRLMLRVNPTTNTINVYLIWLGYTQFGASGVNSTRTATVNAWTHIALVRSSGVFYLYINGVLDATINSSFNPQDIGFTTFNALEIGRNQDGTQPEFQGYISNARLNKSAVYTSAFTPPTSPLTNVTNTSLLTCQYAGTVRNVGFIDSGPYDFPITRVGNTTQGSFSPFSKPDGRWGNYFNGTVAIQDGILSVPDNAALVLTSTAFTIEAWVNMAYNTTSYTNWIVGKRSTSGGTGYAFSYVLGINPSGYPHFFNGTFDVISSTAISLNTWNHVCVTHDGTNATLYLNGSVVAGPTAATIVDTSAAVTIGNYSVDTPEFNGYISGVKIVKGYANAPSGIPTTPATATVGTSLLTCQSNRFVDNSTNNFAITAAGNVKVTPFSPFPLTTEYSPSVNGGSGYFDGSGDYLVTPTDNAFALGGTFVLEAWVYPTSYNPNNGCILFDVRDTNEVGVISIKGTGTAGQIGWQIGPTTGSTLSTTKSIPLYAWTHVVAVSDANGTSIFLDGVRDANSATQATWPSAARDCWIGNPFGGGAGSSFFGWMADARVIKGGTLPYASTSTTIAVPTAPLTAITNTSLLCNFANAGIFDNTGFNVLESVGNSQVDTTTKKYGTGSLSFDGTGDYLKAAFGNNFDFGTGPFTVEFWLYLNATTNQCFLDLRTGSPFLFDYSSNALRYYANSTVITGSALSTGQWYHIALTRDSSSNNRMFVDGTQTGSTVSNSTNLTGTTIAYIGANYVGGDALNGFIDDLRITKGVARYTTAFTPPDKAFPNVGV